MGHDQSHGLDMAWPVGTKRPDPPVPRALPLPNLTHLDRLDATAWLRESMTTFGTSVASLLPGHFPAYVRIYHPFESGHGSSRWGEQSKYSNLDLADPAAAEDFAYNGGDDAQARVGQAPPALMETLIGHLGPVTDTTEQCYYALWEGFSGTVVPHDLEPKLVLPFRAYHVFTGPLSAALTSYGLYEFTNDFANLWWPEDHSWCVATEIDSAWTYVGGSRALIDALLADPRLESVETSASARW